jgi:hypothetical protein
VPVVERIGPAAFNQPRTDVCARLLEHTDLADRIRRDSEGAEIRRSQRLTSPNENPRRERALFSAYTEVQGAML